MTASRDAGFTLVELLIGLALLGVLSLLMLSGFEVTAGAWHRVDARGMAGRDRQAAENVLRDRLSQAYPAVMADAAGANSVDFAGSPDRIEFLAPLPERFGARVFVRYTLFIEGGSLRLAWTMAGRAGESEPPASAAVLDDLSAFAIAYFGVDDPANPPHWQDRWQGRKGLPSLIRFHLDQGAGATAAWPDLMVAPLISADARCVFDPSDGACRGL